MDHIKKTKTIYPESMGEEEDYILYSTYRGVPMHSLSMARGPGVPPLSLRPSRISSLFSPVTFGLVGSKGCLKWLLTGILLEATFPLSLSPAFHTPL